MLAIKVIGQPGSGKSTLTVALAEFLRTYGFSVNVHLMDQTEKSVSDDLPVRMKGLSEIRKVDIFEENSRRAGFRE